MNDDNDREPGAAEQPVLPIVRRLSDLSEDQLAFLIEFVRAGAAGQNGLCLLYRILVGLGRIALVLSTIGGVCYAIWAHSPWGK